VGTCGYVRLYTEGREIEEVRMQMRCVSLNLAVYVPGPYFQVLCFHFHFRFGPGHRGHTRMAVHSHWLPRPEAKVPVSTVPS